MRRIVKEISERFWYKTTNVTINSRESGLILVVTQVWLRPIRVHFNSLANIYRTFSLLVINLPKTCSTNHANFRRRDTSYVSPHPIKINSS